jgi:hypothetical protein
MELHLIAYLKTLGNSESKEHLGNEECIPYGLHQLQSVYGTVYINTIQKVKNTLAMKSAFHMDCTNCSLFMEQFI